MKKPPKSTRTWVSTMVGAKPSTNSSPSRRKCERPVWPRRAVLLFARPCSATGAQKRAAEYRDKAAEEDAAARGGGPGLGRPEAQRRSTARTFALPATIPTISDCAGQYYS